MPSTLLNSLKPLIEFRNVSKQFGSLFANKDMSFGVRQGAVHAIIGENGAGKTTAMRMLFGFEDPSFGDILFKGEIKPWNNPRGALLHRVGMVHQHFMLSPVHSALDNVLLGREFLLKSKSKGSGIKLFGTILSRIQRKKIHAELESLCQTMGFLIPWHESVENLPVGIQQQLEIIKLLHAGVDLMIFDEPTAVLAPLEIQMFIQMLKNLNQEGKTILIITHKLQEVKDIADEFTVLRKGRVVATKKCADVSIQEMADLMIGRHVSLKPLPRAACTPGQAVVEIENLSITRAGKKNKLTNISMTVAKNQIVGIAGVEGSGQNELVRLICMPKGSKASGYRLTGKLSLFGKPGLKFSATKVRRQSIGIVPSDRLREAVLADETILENDLLGHDHEFTKGWFFPFKWIDRDAARERIAGELRDFDVRPENPDHILGQLSGGNQQKFVMARELSRHPELIVCAQPTRGVDVGSIEQIHTEILKRRENGAAILLISSQLEELMALADVIHVMFEGRMVASFERSEFDEARIGVAMGGGGA